MISLHNLYTDPLATQPFATYLCTATKNQAGQWTYTMNSGKEYATIIMTEQMKNVPVGHVICVLATSTRIKEHCAREIANLSDLNMVTRNGVGVLAGQRLNTNGAIEIRFNLSRTSAPLTIIGVQVTTLDDWRILHAMVDQGELDAPYFNGDTGLHVN